MSTQGPCQTATSPINISKSAKDCTSICNYQYSYGLSDCQLTNKGDYLSIITSQSGNSVSFNNTIYSLTGCRLYRPSLHTYNGSHAEAELILVHGGSGGKNLLVCIPVVSGKGSSQSATFFNAFVPLAPQTEGGKASVNVNNWTLNTVIPKAGYYFYQATAPFPPCTGSFNFVVFDKSSPAYIAAADLPHLEAAVKAQTYVVKPTIPTGLFYNRGGTINGGAPGISGSSSGNSGSDSEIYIDCRPVGQEDDDDEDESVYTIPKFNFEHDEDKLKQFFKGKTGMTLVSVLVGIVALIILKKVYNIVLGTLFKKK